MADDAITFVDDDKPVAPVDRFADVPLRISRIWKVFGSASTDKWISSVVPEEFQTYAAFDPSHPQCPPQVLLIGGGGGCMRMSARFTTTQARVLAAELLKAADVVEPVFAQWKSIVSGEVHP